MKISAPQRTLLTALSRIQGIVEKTSIKPITSNALICAKDSVLSVSATNLQIGMTARYTDLKIYEEGTISVNAKKIYEIIKELPDLEISINEDKNLSIEIKCGKKVRFTVNGLPPEDFPVFMKENDDNNPVTWKKETFLKLTDLTTFSISKDETKQNICGAYFENIGNNSVRIVTTDGYRLSIVDGDMGQGLEGIPGVVIPHKAITELNKILIDNEHEQNFILQVEKGKVRVKTGDVDFFINLIDKKFPDYKIIIPGDGYICERGRIAKKDLRPALKRMSIISNENTRPVVFSFRGNSLDMFTEDNELGSVKETIDIKGGVKKEFSFCINCMYLLDIINVIEEENIIIEYNLEEENKPIIIKPEKKENIKYIIMPMIIE